MNVVMLELNVFDSDISEITRELPLPKRTNLLLADESV